MDESAIRALVRQLDTEDENAAYEVWQQLGPLREELIPFLLELYHSARKWKCRCSIVFEFHYFAQHRRTRDLAFQLGLAACDDRARRVRYWACSLLAYSRRRAAIPKLKRLLSHPDPDTVADAKAAIRAIRWRCYDLFLNRTWNPFLWGHTDGGWKLNGPQPPSPWWKRTVRWLARCGWPEF